MKYDRDDLRDVRARVAIHLDEQLHGKAVSQNEQQRAEREAGALAAVQALSDTALAERAAIALGRAGKALPELSIGPLGIAETAEVTEPCFAQLVWEAKLA